MHEKWTTRRKRISMALLAMLTVLCVAPSNFIAASAQERGEPAATAVPSADEAAFAVRIEASLDPMEWTIEGKETLAVYNRSTLPMSELVLRCMPNAFANSEALRRAGLSMPCVTSNRERGCDHLGFIDLRELRMADGRTPDPAPVMDGTVLRMALGTPVEPGGSITITLDFLVKLPDRSLGWIGRKGRHVDASQWFPLPALRTDTGWDLEHGNPRPLGDVEVSLSLPSSFTVDAGGALKESHVENAIKTVRYEAKRVPDLAWTADPAAVTETNIFEDVEIVLHRQPFMEAKAESLLDAAKACLRYAHQNLLAYPHKRLVISTPPYGLGPDIESPMFLSARQGFPTHLKALNERTMSPALQLIRSWADAYMQEIIRDKPGSRVPLSAGLADYVALKIMKEHFDEPETERMLTAMEHGIIRHVLNHGFGLDGPDRSDTAEGVCCGKLRPYYGLVNVNSVMGFDDGPFEDDPIDRSFLGYRLGAMNRGGLERERVARFRNESATPVRNAAYACPGAAQAARIALGLLTLERRVGEEKCREIIKGFVERYAFKNAGIDEFLDQAEAIAGADESAFAALALDPDATVDMAVASISCHPEKLPNGYITQKAISDPIAENAAHDSDEGSSKGFGIGKLIEWNGDGVAANPSPDQGADMPGWRWEVVVTNYGTAALPAEVRLTFRSGKTETREWDGLGRRVVLSGSGADPLVSARVDPEGVYLMDLDGLNNFRSMAFQEQGVLFLAAWLQFWTQSYLNGWAFLN